MCPNNDFQWGTQLTEGVTQSTHGGRNIFRDAFSYPLDVFSNYTLYTMQFGKYERNILFVALLTGHLHSRRIRLCNKPNIQ